MEKELIINSFENEVDIALLEDKFLVELHKEKLDNNYAVGDVYLGRVRKIMPGLNAAFIDVGYEKDGFLHYLDLGPQVKSLNKFVSIDVNISCMFCTSPVTLVTRRPTLFFVKKVP